MSVADYTPYVRRLLMLLEGIASTLTSYNLCLMVQQQSLSLSSSTTCLAYSAKQGYNSLYPKKNQAIPSPLPIVWSWLISLD